VSIEGSVRRDPSVQCRSGCGIVIVRGRPTTRRARRGGQPPVSFDGTVPATEPEDVASAGHGVDQVEKQPERRPTRHGLFPMASDLALGVDCGGSRRIMYPAGRAENIF